ncbi:hypothetical protein BV25DRAFT_1842452 [Artomyces pyxidatus]|uniref:Uncharacterized protein n=1 Tax=Artomyces pyxidatus TaxID=48021 RepID=A0ACB8SHZ0_9AGAM|nr:hypothetical protein BV25DRAFT_1842452 [Artomyces pyxidatus]
MEQDIPTCVQSVRTVDVAKRIETLQGDVARYRKANRGQRLKIRGGQTEDEWLSQRKSELDLLEQRQKGSGSVDLPEDAMETSQIGIHLDVGRLESDLQNMSFGNENNSSLTKVQAGQGGDISSAPGMHPNLSDAFQGKVTAKQIMDVRNAWSLYSRTTARDEQGCAPSDFGWPVTTDLSAGDPEPSVCKNILEWVNDVFPLHEAPQRATSPFPDSSPLQTVFYFDDENQERAILTHKIAVRARQYPEKYSGVLEEGRALALEALRSKDGDVKCLHCRGAGRAANKPRKAQSLRSQGEGYLDCGCPVTSSLLEFWVFKNSSNYLNEVPTPENNVEVRESVGKEGHHYRLGFTALNLPYIAAAVKEVSRLEVDDLLQPRTQRTLTTLWRIAEQLPSEVPEEMQGIFVEWSHLYNIKTGNFAPPDLAQFLTAIPEAKMKGSPAGLLLEVELQCVREPLKAVKLEYRKATANSSTSRKGCVQASPWKPRSSPTKRSNSGTDHGDEDAMFKTVPLLTMLKRLPALRASHAYHFGAHPGKANEARFPLSITFGDLCKLKEYAHRELWLWDIKVRDARYIQTAAVWDREIQTVPERERETHTPDALSNDQSMSAPAAGKLTETQDVGLRAMFPPTLFYSESSSPKARSAVQGALLASSSDIWPCISHKFPNLTWHSGGKCARDSSSTDKSNPNGPPTGPTKHTFVVHAPDKTDEGILERRLSVRPSSASASPTGSSPFPAVPSHAGAFIARYFPSARALAGPVMFLWQLLAGFTFVSGAFLSSFISVVTVLTCVAARVASLLPLPPPPDACVRVCLYPAFAGFPTLSLKDEGRVLSWFLVSPRCLLTIPHLEHCIMSFRLCIVPPLRDLEMSPLYEVRFAYLAGLIYPGLARGPLTPSAFKLTSAHFACAAGADAVTSVLTSSGILSDRAALPHVQGHFSNCPILSS